MAPARSDGDTEGPERTCIVTREKGPPENLIRFALSPEGAVVPDIRACLPGRGAWTKADRTVVSEAVRRKSFRRAFKTEVEVEPGLADLLDGLLEKDALQALSLANKAGLVVAGASKIEAARLTRAPTALIHACEGGLDGRRKVEAALRRRFGEELAAMARIQIFRSDQLDLALGRTNVIHAVVAKGTAGDGFVVRSRRLDRYRGGMQADAASPPRISADDTDESAEDQLRHSAVLGNGHGPGTIDL